jgi:hypothetical protein
MKNVVALFLVLILHSSAAVAQGKPCAETGPSGLVKMNTTVKSEDRRYAVERGAWSGQAISLFNTWHLSDTNSGRLACFYSPDLKKEIQIRDENVSISIFGKKFETGFDDFVNAELAWAPDSSRLFVTWTDGGEEGQWRTYVYDVTPKGLISHKDIAVKARLDFEKRIRGLPIDPEMDNKQDRYLWDSADYCEPANVVGSQWLDGSRELLVSILVVNVPARCRYGGEFNVYRIAVPSGDILARYSAREAHRKFNPRNLPIIER